MFSAIRKPKGQSIAEYAVLLGIVSAALFGMQIYIKRGVQAVIKTTADEIGEQKKGGLDVDYRLNWLVKGKQEIASKSGQEKTTTQNKGGGFTYATTDNTTSTGTLSHAIFYEKE